MLLSVESLLLLPSPLLATRPFICLRHRRDAPLLARRRHRFLDLAGSGTARLASSLGRIGALKANSLPMLVENRITGFPVIDDDWKLVGVVSDYDLLALDSISGSGRTDTSMFPEVDSTWKTFNEIQKLLNKTNGRIIGDVMTPAPLVVQETTNLEDAARLLLETKYRRLPVIDNDGKLVGLITRGNVVRAALQIKRDIEKNSKSKM